MSTFKLDASGDLAIENGSLVILSDLVAETAQRLRSKFLFFLGEWHLDDRAGMPLYEKVLVKNPDLREIRALYTEAIERDTAVDTLETLDLDFGAAERKLSLSFEATLTDGSSLTFEDFILAENL